jgi:hypothetical protein
MNPKKKSNGPSSGEQDTKKSVLLYPYLYSEAGNSVITANVTEVLRCII